MTKRQSECFYFPAWARATRAHDWKMAKGRLIGQRASSFGAPDINDLYQAVWTLAGKIAAQEHRSINADDLRHGCHRVALGHDKSSKLFTNNEVDKVVNLFKILADENDLDAVLNYLHPENAQHERLVYTATRLAPEEYIQSIANDLFMGADWQSLDVADLRRLVGKLRARGPQDFATKEHREHKESEEAPF